jgi:lipopolysaccharide export system protein LptA
MNASPRHNRGGLIDKAILLMLIWGAAALFMALFWVKESDLSAARQELRHQKSSPPESKDSVLPEISRQNFWFGEPVPGQKGKYQWEVSGKRSVPINANTDKILDFKGKQHDRDEIVELSSPIVFFDKENRVISSQNDVVLQTQWARIEAPEVVMEMKTRNAKFSGGVTTTIDREEAEKRQLTGESPPPEKTPPEETPDTSDESKKKERIPLVITSQQLRMYSEKNLAIFIGNVVAKDESGIIYADTMEAYNYSDEEQKKDAKLKGVKTVICIGSVKIDQMGKKQALCEKAVYDAKSNIVHLYSDPKTGRKVVYRDEEQKFQAKALEMILDRNKNEVTFTGPEDKGEVEVIDFNKDRKSFLGLMEPGTDKSDKPESGAESNK